ncbi:MAG: DUF3341 domain-containing protein [candidate division Zixibacteria bacterium]|nr:DUF3341 domain-containing protein [candidate division Zixibacteria bacterium]MDH3935986.1 DUF3341 domain-containing protein [candidate division Zixibacteria bacterium]MDH4034678.1 DUF3341 domain-containing protein [candidate division Zixibacteria bacterium]
MSRATAKLVGLLAQFDTPQALLDAAQVVHKAGIKKFDSHSPFAIHGMDDAMGLKRSPLGYIVGVMGTIGLLGALGLQYWTSSQAYPLVISGKPLFSYQAFVPVTFAITVLLSAFGAFFGLLGLNRLPRLNHPLFNSDKFSRVVDGGFFISIEADDPEFEDAKVRQLLTSLGANSIEEVRE